MQASRPSRAPGAHPSRKGLIKVGYGCNEHCTFCHTLDVRHLDGDAAAVARKIDRAAALGYETVVLSGGEPTIRPELLPWARQAARRGLGFGLVTNGQMLAYPQLVAELEACGLEYVYMSLHGGSARVHNANVRADGFANTYRALQNLSGRGLDLNLNCVVTRANVGQLRELVDLCLPFADATLKFSMTEPKGGGDKLFDVIVPSVTAAAAAVADAITYGLARGGRYNHGGLPLCLLPGLEELHADLRSHGFCSMTDTWEDDFHAVDNAAMTTPAACGDCRRRGACPGLYKGYLERRGDAEVRPRGGARSNSFHYAPAARTWVWADGDDCPVRREGPLPHHRGRAVFLRDGARLRLFESRTRDLNDHEIDGVKALAQLYLDVSDKAAPDDFRADLRKLVPVPACATCPEQPRCAGAYQTADDDAFGRDDERLRQRLRALAGEVLDVGCGDGRYGDTLAPLVQTGRVVYRGVDPDAAAVARMRRAWPWATVEVGRAEALDLAERSVDHVLVLNSYNHLEDPRAALARLVRALRVGGSLLVADNVAFGLLRTAEQAARAEAGPAGFEHHRNHDSHAAQELLAGLPLSLVDRQDVGPATSNLWYLHYQRTDAAAAAAEPPC